METLAQRLVRLRGERGFETQEALAKAAGIRQSFIGALEAGNQQGSNYLPDIANALGVDAYYLKYGVRQLVAGDRTIDAIVELLTHTAREGRAVVLDKAKEMRTAYPNDHEQTA